MAEQPKDLSSEPRWPGIARRIRDEHWLFMERCAEHDPLWYCVWNKTRQPELPDEWRDALVNGMELLDWVNRHPDWFVVGEWDDDRYARPYRLTAAGHAALADRALYDMEPVYGGLVEPGWQCIPAAPDHA